MLFIMLCKVVLAFHSVTLTIQMKATEQYFPVVLFIMLYKVVLTLNSVSLTIQVRVRATEQCFPVPWYCLLCCTRWF